MKTKKKFTDATIRLDIIIIYRRSFMYALFLLMLNNGFGSLKILFLAHNQLRALYSKRGQLKLVESFLWVRISVSYAA